MKTEKKQPVISPIMMMSIYFLIAEYYASTHLRNLPHLSIITIHSRSSLSRGLYACLNDLVIEVLSRFS